jgi:hypothetical protein
LAATHALRRLKRDSELVRALRAQRERRYHASLASLSATGSSGEVLARALEHGARDAHAAERLQALAYLIGAYEELEARCQTPRETLRARLGLSAGA